MGRIGDGGDLDISMGSHGGARLFTCWKASFWQDQGAYYVVG